MLRSIVSLVATRPCCVMRRRHRDWYLQIKRSRILINCVAFYVINLWLLNVWLRSVWLRMADLAGKFPFPDIRCPLRNQQNRPSSPSGERCFCRDELPTFHFRLYFSFLSFSFALCLERWPSSIFSPGI
jgi:hypothetical protein